MLHRERLIVALLALWCAGGLHAQDARLGITVPVTVTGEAPYTQRERIYENPNARPLNAAFRAVLRPSLRLGSHWYFYSAIQADSKPFFYYDTYYDERELEARLLQAFLGYTWSGERRAIGVKVGKLSSAFGAFPLRYDDAVNPLLDQPAAYGMNLQLRADALPCGVKDLPNLRYYEEYEGVVFYCGGSREESYGMMPVTLYGLPAIEVNASIGKWDARVQLTNSSPVNARGLFSDSQYAQFAAGAGFTIWQGFRIGVSGFRGPFLTNQVAAALPPGTTVRDYPAAAMGADLQWARGRWSANAEWYRLEFHYPRLRIPARVNAAYGELKAIITPRFYAAMRANWQFNNRVSDALGSSPLPFQPNSQAFEFALGARVNRLQMLKLGYEWVRSDAVRGSRDDVLGLQFVTSLEAFSIAFR